ncbi:hypothetical protein C0J52_24744 [Blattella germanica]|nr:hypothetical protein C0J52_24744 [Blattella germanica]
MFVEDDLDMPNATANAGSNEHLQPASIPQNYYIIASLIYWQTLHNLLLHFSVQPSIERATSNNFTAKRSTEICLPLHYSKGTPRSTA